MGILYNVPLVTVTVQILLHEGSLVTFSNNFATELGAGLYVEYSSSDFILSVLNTGCFIRYNSTSVDVPPIQWVSQPTIKISAALCSNEAGVFIDKGRNPTNSIPAYIP